MEQNNTKNKGGFSLIEILVAMLVLVVLTIAAAAMLAYTGTAVMVQSNSSTAMQVINETLENIDNLDYSSVSTTSTDYTRNGITYTAQTQVTRVSSPLDYKNISIQVQYRGQTFTANTYVIKGFGIQN